jgi:hypothetical protein
MVFTDNILIYSKIEEHPQKALERLRREHLYAKLKKCKLWLDNVSFLGHVISGEGVVVDLEKVEVVVEWTRPTSVIIDASSRVSRSCQHHSLP